MKHTLYIFRLSIPHKVFSYNSVALIKFTDIHIHVGFEVLIAVVTKSANIILGNDG
jgi:hypothetical protein